MHSESEKKQENQIEEGEFEFPTKEQEFEKEIPLTEKRFYSQTEFEELQQTENFNNKSKDDNNSSNNDTSNPYCSRKPSMSSYQKLNQVGEGTFGKVYKAKLKYFTKKTFNSKGDFVALKKILVENEREGFPITAIREITILKKLNHPNIVSLYDIVTSKANSKNGFKGNVYLVFEYMEHDLSGLLAKKYDFSVPMIKCVIKQIFKGIEYMHENNIMHRDLKPANVLVNNQGEVKVGDFGLARYFSAHNINGVYAKKYTNGVVTLWYRPPELLLGTCYYGPSLDVWSLGCLLAELVLGYPIFRGDRN
jgi:cyclin-dependent kinase 12/13